MASLHLKRIKAAKNAGSRRGRSHINCWRYQEGTASITLFQFQVLAPGIQPVRCWFWNGRSHCLLLDGQKSWRRNLNREKRNNRYIRFRCFTIRISFIEIYGTGSKFDGSAAGQINCDFNSFSTLIQICGSGLFICRKERFRFIVKCNHWTHHWDDNAKNKCFFHVGSPWRQK